MTKNKSPKKILQGLIKRHPDGFGFFIPQDLEHPDVFIPASEMRTAMTNDKVTIMAEKERDGRYKGEIIKILERSQKKVAGGFYKLNEKWGIIKDDGKGWGADLKIPLDKSLQAEEGDLVAARIITYPDEASFTGEVVEIIGDIENALNDIKRVIITQNIPDQFTIETLNEAKKFSDNPTEKDFKSRKDLRSLNLITIDGATAKDFDDAVYVETHAKGFRLVVAIADVSHYVKNQSAMDKDAYERGTSVYFPNFVVPMLPEALSNGLCSLNPHVPRLALVADMLFDFTGEKKSHHFYEAVIESKARVTYGEAQEIIDDPDGSTPTHEKFNSVKNNILLCSDLAKLLMAKRFKEGSLDLEVPETELIIDGTGEPIDVVKSERLFAHRLIEEMMLAANVAVAEFLTEKEIPALFRTHEPPDSVKIAMLEKYMHTFGSKTKLAGDRLQKRLTKALQEFKDDPKGQIIHILTLRSMSQAKYTVDNIGHFGLGFDHYSHFTSPIRRYPDLIVHRLLKHAIGLTAYRAMSEADLQTAGTWLSACEQRSAKSERQIHAIKKARFMKNKLGQAFTGIVSSVTKFGVFVLLREFNIDGLLHIDDLGHGTWEYLEDTLTLRNKKTGRSFNLGDSLEVTVSSTDIELGQINFVLDSDIVQHKDQKENHSSSHFSHKKEKSHKNEKQQKRDFKNTSSKNKLDQFKPAKYESEKAESSKTESQFKSSLQSSSQSKTFSQEKPKKEGKDGSSYIPKPKYASLSDYLDQMAKKKGSSQKQESSSNRSSKNISAKSRQDNNKGSKDEFKSSQNSKNKSHRELTENRKNSQKRESSESDSYGVRKTRAQKPHRKSRSR